MYLTMVPASGGLFCSQPADKKSDSNLRQGISFHPRMVPNAYIFTRCLRPVTPAIRLLPIHVADVADIERVALDVERGGGLADG